MRNKIITALLIASILSTGIVQRVFADDLPLFVTITANWCSSCQKLKPVIEELQYEYQGKLKFITLDTTSKSALEESRQVAENNGIGDFFNNNKSSLPKVGIFCPQGKLEKSFTGEIRKETYKEVLSKFLEDSTKICSL